jgi:hypothetical protein
MNDENKINTKLLNLLSKFITGYDVVLDKALDIDITYGYPVCVDGAAASLWFQIEEENHVLTINTALSNSSLITMDDELYDYACCETLSLVMCKISGLFRLVLSQREKDNIEIVIDDKIEKKYKLVCCEDLFINLTGMVADQIL